MKDTIRKIKDEIIKRLPCVFAYAAFVSPVIIRMIRHEFYRYNYYYFLLAIPLLFLEEKFVIKHPHLFISIWCLYCGLIAIIKPF